MFQVKKIDYVNKTFRMPADLVRQMQQAAQRENVSLNRLVILCCEHAMNEMEHKEKAEV